MQNTSYLKQITESVLMMNTLSAGDMVQFFAWVSGSIKMSSKSLDAKARWRNRASASSPGICRCPLIEAIMQKEDMICLNQMTMP